MKIDNKVAECKIFDQIRNSKSYFINCSHYCDYFFRFTLINNVLDVLHFILTYVEYLENIFCITNIAVEYYKKMYKNFFYEFWFHFDKFYFFLQTIYNRVFLEFYISFCYTEKETKCETQLSNISIAHFNS